VENAYTHTWMAYHLFHNFGFPQRHLVARVAFREEVPPGLEEVRRFFWPPAGLRFLCCTIWHGRQPAV